MFAQLAFQNRTGPVPNTAFMRSEPKVRSRRRRTLASVSLLLCAIAVIAALRMAWWSPPVYQPRPGVAVRGVRLDSQAHDARVITLGESPYLLHLEQASSNPPGGALLFFGARHSKDPGHAQLEALRDAWRQFRPTVALVEGRMSFFVGTATQGIRVFGEGAAVYAMAQAAAIPLYTLEPPLELEIAAMDTCGDRTQVAMFRVLSGYISARRGGPVSDFKVRRLLARRARPLTDELPTIEAFDAYFASQFPGGPDWRDLPEQAIWPAGEDTLLHRMATRSNEVRDQHFARTLIDLVDRGHRVLAIAGRSHTINLEPVLVESLSPVRRGALSSSRPWEPPL